MEFAGRIWTSSVPHTLIHGAITQSTFLLLATEFSFKKAGNLIKIPISGTTEDP